MVKLRNGFFCIVSVDASSDASCVCCCEFCWLSAATLHSLNSPIAKNKMADNLLDVLFISSQFFSLLFLCHLAIMNQIRSEFKVHGVVVIPACSGNESMFFKYTNDFFRNTVCVHNFVHFLFSWILPSPEIGIFGADVDCHSVTVGTQPVASSHFSPVESGRLVEIFAITCRKSRQLFFYSTQTVRRTVDFRES